MFYDHNHVGVTLQCFKSNNNNKKDGWGNNELLVVGVGWSTDPCKTGFFNYTLVTFHYNYMHILIQKKTY